MPVPSPLPVPLTDSAALALSAPVFGEFGFKFFKNTKTHDEMMPVATLTR
jgi:hypothetical protein